jgi:hypothetical protein
VAELAGFWSYVHADDDADGGRVSRLARDVVAQYEMLTGEKIDLFLDRDNIPWGEEWRKKIDQSLSSIAFFISVLTPRYFMSSECRRELQKFARSARDLGIEELVLPLLYVDVPGLHEDIPSDDLVALVKTFQWEDWRELRFSDIGSGEYRRGVVRLAQRLVEANRKAAETSVSAALSEREPLESDANDSPGLLDQMAAAEETLPKWQLTVEAIGVQIALVGQIAEKAAEEMTRGDAQGKGFAARLTVARSLAQRLREPSERVWSLGNEFATQLYQIDDGLRALIEQASSEVHESPEARIHVCVFFYVVRNLSDATHEGLASLQGLIDEISPVESLSRDLRDPLRRLRQGFTLMLEAREVADEWVNLIERTGIDCDDVSAEDVERHLEGGEREVRDLD